MRSADGTPGTVAAVPGVPAPATMHTLTVEWVATFLVGAGQWVVHNADDACELFYRAMSETEYRRVNEAGGLVTRAQGSNELFITPDQDYALDLINRRGGQRKYPIVVEFELEFGTEDMLIKLGATHNSARSTYPNLPAFTSGMNAVQIKFERLGNIRVPSFAVGHSPKALEQFNKMIMRLTQVER